MSQSFLAHKSILYSVACSSYTGQRADESQRQTQAHLIPGNLLKYKNKNTKQTKLHTPNIPVFLGPHDL